MAVEKKSKETKRPEPQIRDYWKRYHRSAMITTTLMEILVTLVIGFALLVGGISPEKESFWITMFATLVTTTLLNYVIIDLLLAPLRDLAMAITTSAGQKPTHPLANPNIERYRKNGFRPVLQYIYETSAEKSQPQPEFENSPNSEESHRLATALDQTNAGIIIMNASGKIVYANHSAPVKKDTSDTLQLDLLFERESAFDDWLATCRDSAVHAEQSWLRVPDRIVGEEGRRIFNVTANYEKGSVAEVVLVTYDATNMYQQEDEDLDFISFAAHELRGPITVIRGYLDVLDVELEGQLAPDQKELFSRLIVSANRLSGYINNILNASRFDRHHLKINLAEDSLIAIYDTIRDDMQLRASTQHRRLNISIPPNLPTIAADRSSLSEVLSNLIDNALKYSNEDGTVSVTASVEGDYVRVDVIDHGIGIPANVVSNLFHKFYRSHRSRETVAGTGIGLYICKAIVESHGGKIGVTSTEGVGSTFSFTVLTYASVADKLQANDYTNDGLISSSDSWIKNHSKYSG